MPLCVKANAKINLNLRIVGKRPDGYHLLKTVMQSVDLCDSLSFEKAESGITLNCDNALLQNSENLVHTAAKAFFKAAKIQGGVKISLKKNIPVKSGLGGGSADAAATLLALNKLYKKPLNTVEIKNLAATLGADVPFFIDGGTVLCEGIGEKTTPLPYVGDYYCLLVICGEKSSTKSMYEQVDKQIEEHNNTQISTDKLLCQNAYNSFLDALDYKETVLDVISSLNNFGAIATGLSGSGPTVYALFKNETDLIAANGFLSLEFETRVCKTSTKSVIIDE